MNRLVLALVCAASLGVASSGAQQPAPPPPPPAQPPQPPAPSSEDIMITFADGKTLTAEAVKRADGNLVVTKVIAAGAKSQMNFPLTNVKSIAFPEPPELKTAQQLLAGGKAREALATADRIVALQVPFRDVEGNWWTQASLLKMNALISLKRSQEAEALISELASVSKDPQALHEAKIALASLGASGGRAKEAIATFDEILAESKVPAIQAKAWLGKGRAFLALGNSDAAVLSLLRVPVFFPEQIDLVPTAMFETVGAYIKLGQRQEAIASLNEIIEKYPSARESAPAKAELDRLSKN